MTNSRTVTSEISTRYSATSRVVLGGLKLHRWCTISRNEPRVVDLWRHDNREGDRELPRDIQRCAGNRKSERIELAPPVTDADRDAPDVRFFGARQGSKTCTGCATDGTPFLSVRKSMYQPGGAMFGSPVSVTRTVPPACEVIGRSTRRCPVLNEWVVTP
jgi:hypothetical protein